MLRDNKKNIVRTKTKRSLNSVEVENSETIN